MKTRMKTRWIEVFIIVMALGLLSLCFGVWDNTKPADSDGVYTWPNSIRANWDALEAKFGVDLADAVLGGVINVKSPTYGAVGDGVADDTAAIQAAIDVGDPAIFLPKGNYKITAALVPKEGQTIFGMGKASTGTRITLGADVTAFNIFNIVDVTISNILITTHAAQTEPVIEITASTVSVSRINVKGVQISAAAQDFSAIRLQTLIGAYGIWNCNFDDISISGCGTVVEMETNSVGSWINSNRFTNFYVNDFVKAIELIITAGNGAGNCLFMGWGCQCSARTTYGLLIPNSPEGRNSYTQLLGVNFYDMPVGGKYYSLGTGVVATQVQLSRGDMDVTKITDNGIRTCIYGYRHYFRGAITVHNNISIANTTGGLHGPAADDSYFILTARDNGVGGVEVARVQGAADPYFKVNSLVYGIGTLADDATPSIGGNSVWLTGGTTGITDFDDGYEGLIITIIGQHILIITDGANIVLDGGANMSMTSGDTLMLIQLADTKWYQLSESDNN